MLNLILAQSGGDPDAGGVIGAIFGLCCSCLIPLVLTITMIAGMWKIFEKAGKPGWAAIVPFYNMMVLAEIVGRPAWFGLLVIIPFVGIIVAIMLAIELAKSFGKDTLYAIGLILVPFVFYPMLGFGSAKYTGPAAQQS